VTENGFGKRTPVSDYRKTNRGGSGIINIKSSDRNGPAVGLKGVTDGHDVMLITKNGIIIRSDVTKISVVGRNTQGVRLINLEPGDAVMDIALCEKQSEADGAVSLQESNNAAPPSGEAPGPAASGPKPPEDVPPQSPPL
jgi:DNA gyrase subunit A